MPTPYQLRESSYPELISPHKLSPIYCRTYEMSNEDELGSDLHEVSQTKNIVATSLSQ